MNPLFDTASIQRYLDSFSSQNRRRGRIYFAQKTVLKVACLTADRRYSARVRGSLDYEVTFEYDPAVKSWSAECTCPVPYECKHAYAAMLTLQANAAQLSSAAPAPEKKARKSKGAGKPSAPEPSPAPQPPQSPVCVALTQALGRPLNPTEIDHVQRVQWLHQQVAAGRSMTLEALRTLTTGQLEYSWTALTLWPEFPQNDLELYLYCAWELRRRDLSPLPSLKPITDFALIEPKMRAWERNKAIQTWRTRLADEPERAQTEPEVMDIRLMILPTEARLQWKLETEEAFKDLKQTHLRRLTDQYQSGTLTLHPDAAPLWLILYKPYDYYTLCNLRYDLKEPEKLLARALHLFHEPSRWVRNDGTPLARPLEPLRYRLQPATTEEEDYEVELVQADGSPAPPILVTVSGRPALYLTENALFQGPPPHGYSLAKPLRIPAPALETPAGLIFLDRLKLDMPTRLADRIRHVPVKLKLTAAVKEAYPGSPAHNVLLRITSEGPGVEPEHCGSWGWSPLSGAGAKKKVPAESNGTITLVDRSLQRRFPALFENLGAKWDDYAVRWRVRITKNFPELFVPWLEALPKEVEVDLDPQLATLRDQPVSGTVSLDVAEAGVDWFDLKVTLDVSDTQLTQDELKILLNAGGKFVRLGKKGWRRLQFNLTEEEDETLARLGLNARDFTAEPQRLHALQLADDSARRFLPQEQVAAIQRRAAELVSRVTPPVPAHIAAQLRPYQVEGFHFLAYLSANRFGGVLADDMGLGKTLQTLTWLAWMRQGGLHLLESPPANGQSHTPPAPLPSLVVCPKSVMDNWRTEAERFCPGLRVRLWHGEDATVLATARAEADLIVLNYAQLRSLSPEVAQHRWQAAILDEAQGIKNPDSQTAQAARALTADHRVALTGTPIENRLLDLWSILGFAMPGVLGNRAQFARSYNAQDDPLARRRLASRVRPFLLRRTKGQVAQDLPDRIEEDLVCEMEGEQKTLYRAEFKRAQQLLLNVKTQKELNEQRFHFLTSLLRLRQICCHPALVSEELQKSESAKLNALFELLEPLMEGGHKVLVFSQFVSMLEILAAATRERKWPYFYLAGDTENRGALVADFQKAEGAAIFLISLKAGGFGLNLTAASYVVLFDPWWNPAVEMQAIDRTHRIGQTSKVVAYRLLVKDSIEQKIRQLQRSKAALADDVLGEEKFAQALTLDDLQFLFEGSAE